MPASQPFASVEPASASWQASCVTRSTTFLDATLFAQHASFPLVKGWPLFFPLSCNPPTGEGSLVGQDGGGTAS